MSKKKRKLRVIEEEKNSVVAAISAVMDQNGRCVTEVEGPDEKIINLLSTVLAGYIAGIAKAYKIKSETLRDDIFKDITRLIDDFLKKGGLY